MAISQNGKAAEQATAPQQTSTAATPAATAPATSLTASDLQALQAKELEQAQKAYFDKALKLAGERASLAECVEVEDWPDAKGVTRYTAHLCLVSKNKEGTLDGSEVFRIPHSKYWAAKVGRYYWAEIVVAQLPTMKKDKTGAYNKAVCVVNWHEVPMGV
jgi:hypothetical protein